MDAATREWCARVRRALVVELEAIVPGWNDTGKEVHGLGAFAVRVEDHHRIGPGHIDIGIVLNRARADSPVIWDCAAGGRAQDDAGAERAARIWASTTAPTVLELAARDGRFAEHAHGDDSLGLSTWHSIHSGILGYGSGDPEPIQSWLLEHPLVPALGSLLDERLAPGTLHGVKILVGAFDEPIAEVRIDGVRDEACSDALLELVPWSRFPRKTVARQFVLFVHRY